jgi:hypothetical protein
MSSLFFYDWLSVVLSQGLLSNVEENTQERKSRPSVKWKALQFQVRGMFSRIKTCLILGCRFWGWVQFFGLLVLKSMVLG